MLKFHNFMKIPQIHLQLITKIINKIFSSQSLNSTFDLYSGLCMNKHNPNQAQ